MTLKQLLLPAILCLIHPLTGVAENTNTPRRVQFRERCQTHYFLVKPANGDSRDRLGSRTLALPAWTQARLADSADLVELGSRVVLQLEPGRSLATYVRGRDLVLSRTINSNLFILDATDSQAAIDLAEKLAKEEGVLACYPVMRHPLKLHNAYAKAPNDPLFKQQWHLENRGSDFNLNGPDLNARAAWPMTRGENVLVAVVDDGFQLDHPELVDRGRSTPHFNFARSTANGGPASANAHHATAVAGLISAEGNNQRGVSGVAPQARLASWVIFGTSYFGRESIATDEQLMDMFQYASNRVAVQNHSWGSASVAQLALDALSDAGIANAVTKGRDGKGVIMVRAAGNEREDLTNANDDGFANDPRAIAVAAVRKDGRAASYSSPGACLLVAAPSGDVKDTNNDGQPDGADPEAPDVLTTDRTGRVGFNTNPGDAGDYANFNGTSASSPQVAGVVALMLSANPNLTYRDVQQILIHSARHYDLADPDARLNGAGFRFSHNVGFGVPDAGFAVELAKNWSNRPPVKTITSTNTTRQDIPDDALRVVCGAAGISDSLTSIRCIPSLGLHPDEPSDALPIVFGGQANEELSQDLNGKAALIQRGGSFFSDKIARAARAGAAFAIVFNNTGTTAIQPMGGTTFVPIPAVSIGKNDGDALREFVSSHPDTTVRLQLTPAVFRFNITDTLVCEHIGVRLKTTHPRRSDVRVTLVSPMGRRSILQAINGDNSAGPRDWTYWTTQHFYESSAGEWRLEVSDERNTILGNAPSGSTPAKGSVTYAELIIRGVPVADTDRDGLDDDWEYQHFGHLDYGPKDDPDEDGFANAREQIMVTKPTAPNTAFRLDLAELTPGYLRLSWPSQENASYSVLSGGVLTQPLATVKNVAGSMPVTEFVVETQSGDQFYRVFREANQHDGTIQLPE